MKILPMVHLIVTYHVVDEHAELHAERVIRNVNVVDTKYLKLFLMVVLI